MTMPLVSRSTLIVHGRLAMREARLSAARLGHHGQQIMAFEQAAVRLAGGFTRAVDDESLCGILQTVLPLTPMGELESIKTLPGMVDAAADTLRKVWRAGIELAPRAGDHPRLEAMARLEAAVIAQLPAGMMKPVDIVAAAMKRIAHAPAVLGSMEIVGLTELSPCWRPLLLALAGIIPVRWNAGPRSVPDWLEGTAVTIERAPAQATKAALVSAATSYHEAIEAMRWARALLASGIPASDIAIAAASPAEYDDDFLALNADANLDLHFVHGIPVVTTRDGQAAAALADIVVRGLSQARLSRLAAHCAGSGLFAPLPEGWLRILPREAPLASMAAWNRLFVGLSAESWPDGVDHGPALRAVVEMLDRGPAAAAEIGEAFLNGRSREIWRKALLAGPSGAIDATLALMKEDNGLEACTSIVWMPASALAASPRRHVRLLGLNSARWPRGIAEDRLIPNHIIPTRELDPLPVNLADRRDFETICTTTTGSLVMSRARRDRDGRLLGRSPLLAGLGAETYLRRNGVPEHAHSETDRLMARPEEFSAEPQAVSAMTCWRNWRRPELTAHDGLVRPDHPLIQAILERKQSATSLTQLLRNPLGFVWKYAFQWQEPESSAEPLTIDNASLGNLVHAVLDHALRSLESAGGLNGAKASAIEAAVASATVRVAAEWEREQPIPPRLIWDRSLAEIRQYACRALTHPDTVLPDGRAFSEVSFGSSEPKHGAPQPWDWQAEVAIPETGFRISGYIDRLDIAADGRQAHVYDYKTGKTPEDPPRLRGGRELQRCLYAFAVKALLGPEFRISASLVFPRDGAVFPLDDPEATLADLAGYLRLARENLASGAALPGTDAADTYDSLAFALPANAKATYCEWKAEAIAKRLGDATKIWDEE